MAETIKMDVKSRIDAAKKSDDFRATHAVFKNGVLTALHCKLCGVQIAGLISDDTRQEKSMMNGVVIIRERLLFSYFGNYRESLLTFDDGSRHVTSSCADCAPKMVAPETAEAVYAMDLSQWESEGAKVQKNIGERAGAKLSRTAPIITE